MQKCQYGAMSSMYELEANNKFTAYCAMCCHYDRSAHLIAIYSPEDCKDDSWLNPLGAISERLDEVFQEVGSFDNYFESHIEDIKASLETIRRVV